MIGYFYIFATIFFTVYGQLVLKWRVGLYGPLPAAIDEKIVFLTRLLVDPFLLSGLVSAFVASIFWLAAMTRFEISYAYPFMSLAFVLVLMFSVVLFNESLTVHKIAGLLLIITGIIISSRS